MFIIDNQWTQVPDADFYPPDLVHLNQSLNRPGAMHIHVWNAETSSSDKKATVEMFRALCTQAARKRSVDEWQTVPMYKRADSTEIVDIEFVECSE
jgi:hypothetical protein